MVNIINFVQFNEKIENLFGEEIRKYADELLILVNKAYSNIGGIKGSGFKSVDDMVENIKMVKTYIDKKEDKIKVAIFYKDKGGRKVVGLATDKSVISFQKLENFLKYEFKRSYFEVSSNLLTYIQKNFPDEFEKYKIRNDTNLPIFSNIEKVDDYYYTREINGEHITKIVLGTPNINFY